MMRWFYHLLRCALALLPMAAVASSTASTAPPPPVVVSGAGPASLLFTLRYLQLNPDARVEIYEKRARPSTSSNGSGSTGFRAFGFGIGGRAKAQLEKVPGLLECVESIVEPSVFWFANHGDLCFTMSELLLGDPNGIYKNRCRIHYECPVLGVHESNRTVCIQRSKKNRGGGNNEEEMIVEEVPYSILVAGDGSNSVIRNQLETQGEVKTTKYHRNIGWKALQLPKQPNLTPGAGQGYGIYVGHPIENGDFGGLLPRFKNQFVLLMFWRRTRRQQNDSLAGSSSTPQGNPFNANTATEFKEAIGKLFPNVTEFPSDQVLQQFFQEPHGIEIYMKLNQHALPKRRVAFLGDAAAGMYSMLGQGVASAWERATLLAETVPSSASSDTTTTTCKIEDDENQDKKMDLALTTFAKESRRQSHAITDLNLVAHVREIPLFAKIFHKPLMTMRRDVMNPEIRYTQMKKRYHLLVWLARILWWCNRLPAATATTQPQQAAEPKQQEAEVVPLQTTTTDTEEDQKPTKHGNTATTMTSNVNKVRAGNSKLENP